MRYLFALLLLAMPALASDTAGSWKPTHTARFGEWDSTCDAIADHERCYLRYVDVYAPRPDFGVLFGFVEADRDGERVSFGIEFETPLNADRLAVMLDGRELWNDAICQDGAPCELTGADADSFLAAMEAGDRLETEFDDSYGRSQKRVWPLTNFRDALSDLRAQAAKRGLGV